jgi:predicted nucleic acid-binding Zn ribbon protein
MCFVLYTDVVITGWPHCVKSEAVVLVTALSSANTQEVNFSNCPRSPDTHSFSVNDLQMKRADQHCLFCSCMTSGAANTSVDACSSNELDREQRRFRNFLQIPLYKPISADTFREIFCYSS